MNWFRRRTICLVVLALAVDIAVSALPILREALALTAVLWVVALLTAIVSLLVLRAAITSWNKGLSGLEGSSSRGEGRSARAEAALRLGLGLVAQVHLLGLLGQVLFLGRRVVFPRVKVRHNGFCWDVARGGIRR